FYVFLMSYLLLFVRQFGPEYDVWANVTAAQPAALTEAGAPEPPVMPEPLSPPPTDEPPAPPPPVQP
ncbi:MAG: hypothetical protein ACJ8LI_12050, partial [Chthoniobacterales bacterium]